MKKNGNHSQSTVPANVLEIADYCVDLERRDVNMRRLRRWRNELMRDRGDCGRYVIEPATVPQDFADSMRLVHDVFVNSGYMSPSKHGLRIRNYYETSTGLVTLVARDVQLGHKIVGTLSIVSDGPLGLPSEEIFGREMKYAREQSRCFCEVAGFAIHADYRHTNLCYDLPRYSAGWTAFAGYDSCFVAVSPKTQNFFREIMLFDKIGVERSYSVTVNDPVVGLWCNPQNVKLRLREIDIALGDDSFLEDYLYCENPVHEYVKYPGIKRVFSAYHDILVEALVQYLSNLDNITIEEKKVAQL